MFKQKTTEQIKVASRKTDSGSHAFYNNPKYRGMIYQTLLIFGLAYFFFAIISNTLGNLEAAGIKSGFGFLNNAAGYDVLMSLIDFDSRSSQYYSCFHSRDFLCYYFRFHFWYYVLF
jgi:ABC-type amino acid transport system permease subunit